MEVDKSPTKDDESHNQTSINTRKDCLDHDDAQKATIDNEIDTSKSKINLPVFSTNSERTSWIIIANSRDELNQIDKKIKSDHSQNQSCSSQTLETQNVIF